MTHKRREQAILKYNLIYMPIFYMFFFMEQYKNGHAIVPVARCSGVYIIMILYFVLEIKQTASDPSLTYFILRRCYFFFKTQYYYIIFVHDDSLIDKPYSPLFILNSAVLQNLSF